MLSIAQNECMCTAVVLIIHTCRSSCPCVWAVFDRWYCSVHDDDATLCNHSLTATAHWSTTWKTRVNWCLVHFSYACWSYENMRQCICPVTSLPLWYYARIGCQTLCAMWSSHTVLVRETAGTVPVMHSIYCTTLVLCRHTQTLCCCFFLTW